MTIRSFKRAGAATLLAAFVATSGYASLSAMAAPTIPDPDATANLIIHKYNGENSNLSNDGRTLTEADVTAEGAVPMANVVFDVYQVFYDAAHATAVDLTTNQGWNDAAVIRDYTPTQAEILAGSFSIGGATYHIQAADSVTTGADGVATTEDLPIGLYLVNENRAATAAAAGEDMTGLTPALPFLVTLPMTDPTSQAGWDYTVDVYPKNVQDSITKQVLDGNQNVAGQDSYRVGEDLTYRLTSTIQVSDTTNDGLVDGDDLGYYSVIDQMEAEMTYKSVTITPFDADGVAGAALVEGDDFVVHYDDAAKRVVFSLTDAGLDKIAGFGDGTLRTDMVATVTLQPGDGIVANTAALIPSNNWLAAYDKAPGTPGELPPTDSPEIPSNEVDSRFGDVVIQKVDEQGNPLAGAVFQVFRAGADGVCGNDDIYDAAGDLLDPVRTSAGTNADGLTELSGLQLSNYYNGAEVTAPADFHSYCIVEFQAPTGYELQAEPIEFDLTVAGDVVDLTAEYNSAERDANHTDNTGGDLMVANMPHNLGNQLPLTGGAGTAAIAVGGLAVVGGGAYAYRAKRRRDAASEAAAAAPQG